jgi:hypothetical protein
MNHFAFEDHEVAPSIEFDAWATDLLQGREWHSSQKVTTLPGGGSHMHFRLSALEEVERWILSWGDTCQRDWAGGAEGAGGEDSASGGRTLRGRWHVKSEVRSSKSGGNPNGRKRDA